MYEIESGERMRKKYYRHILLFVLLMLIGGCGEDVIPVSRDSASDNQLKIAILQSDDSEEQQEALKGFINTLNSTEQESEQLAFIIRNAKGNELEAQTIAETLIVDQVDLIYTLDALALQAVYEQSLNTEIPVVFAAVEDVDLILEDEQEAQRFSGVSHDLDYKQQLSQFLTLLPQCKVIALPYDSARRSQQKLAEEIQALGKELKLEIQLYGIATRTDLETMLETALEETDAFYLLPRSLNDNEYKLLLAAANEEKIPLLCADKEQFKEGMLATIEIDNYNAGSQAAHIAGAILFDDADPVKYGTQFADKLDLIIDDKVAKELGLNSKTNSSKRSQNGK